MAELDVLYLPELCNQIPRYCSLSFGRWMERARGLEALHPRICRAKLVAGEVQGNVTRKVEECSRFLDSIVELNSLAVHPANLS